jgi:hypothetical protein
MGIRGVMLQVTAMLERSCSEDETTADGGTKAATINAILSSAKHFLCAMQPTKIIIPKKVGTLVWSAIVNKVKAKCTSIEHHKSFQEGCIEHKLGVTKFVQDCPTRWIYLHDVLDRFCKFKPVLLALRDNGIFKDDPDTASFVNIPTFTRLEFMTLCLRSVHFLCKSLQGQSEILLTDVPAMLNKTITTIKRFESNPDVDETSVAFAATLRVALKSRLSHISVNPILLAAAMDPQHCDLAFIEDSVKVLIRERLVSLMQRLDADMTLDLGRSLFETLQRKMKEFIATQPKDISFHLRHEEFWNS